MGLAFVRARKFAGGVVVVSRHGLASNYGEFAIIKAIVVHTLTDLALRPSKGFRSETGGLLCCAVTVGW